MSKPFDPDKCPPSYTADIFAELGRQSLDNARDGLDRRRMDIENLKLFIMLPNDPSKPCNITVNGKPYDPYRNRSRNDETDEQ